MNVLFTARLPRAALAARCTSMSGFWSRNRIGSRVSRSTSLTSRRNVVRCCIYVWCRVMYLALLSRQRSSLRTVVDRCCPSIQAYSARGGVHQKRSRSRLAAQVSMGSSGSRGGGQRTFSRKPSRSATASRSLSANTGSYILSLERPARFCQ